MDLRKTLKDCTVTLCDLKTCKCDLRLNKNFHLPEDFAEFERTSINKERDSHESDELDINRNVWCKRTKRKVVNNFESKKNYKEISSDSEDESSSGEDSSFEMEDESSSDENSSSKNKKKVKLKRKVVRIHESKKKSRKFVSYSEVESSSDENSSSVNKSETRVKNTVVKIQADPKGAERKVVNGFKNKKNYNETESDSEDDEENGFAEHKDEPKTRPPPPRSLRELSSYEQMIKKRYQENMAFLQSIKIDEAKASFSEAMSHVIKKRPRRKQRYETENKSPRKSKRLENCHFVFEERELFLNAQKAALNKERDEEEERLRREERERNAIKDIEVLHTPISFKTAVMSDTRYELHLKDIETHEPKANDEFCLYDKSILESMALSKVSDTFRGIISTMSWHPSSDHLILAAGSEMGNIAIWNVCLQSCPILFWIHRDVYISHSQFSPFNQANSIFSSLDGTVFCADLMQQTFSKVCSLNAACTYFDFYSASTYLVALNSGNVAIVDKRIDEKTSRMSLHTCSTISVETLSNHPVNRNFFITAHGNECKLWDLRKLETEPIAQNYQHEWLRSAFFSPNTGNYILATYRQPCLRMFNFGNTYFENCIELRRTLSVDRDSYSSAATWLPNSGETFSTRHGCSVKGINIYNTDMQDYAYLPTPYKKYFFAAYSFHPKRPVLASAHKSSAPRISVYLKE